MPHSSNRSFSVVSNFACTVGSNNYIDVTSRIPLFRNLCLRKRKFYADACLSIFLQTPRWLLPRQSCNLYHHLRPCHNPSTLRRGHLLSTIPLPLNQSRLAITQAWFTNPLGMPTTLNRRARERQTTKWKPLLQSFWIPSRFAQTKSTVPGSRNASWMLSRSVEDSAVVARAIQVEGSWLHPLLKTLTTTFHCAKPGAEILDLLLTIYRIAIISLSGDDDTRSLRRLEEHKLPQGRNAGFRFTLLYYHQKLGAAFTLDLKCSNQKLEEKDTHCMHLCAMSALGLGALNRTLDIILILLSSISICLCHCCPLSHACLHSCNSFYDNFTLTIRDACSQFYAHHPHVDITSFSYDILGTDDHSTQPCNHISFTIPQPYPYNPSIHEHTTHLNNNRTQSSTLPTKLHASKPGLIPITGIVSPRIAAKCGVIDIPQRWRRRILQAMEIVNLCFVEFAHKCVWKEWSGRERWKEGNKLPHSVIPTAWSS